MISSYEGGCLKNTGWESLKTQTNGYIMPFISKLEGNFPQWTALDSWYWLVYDLMRISCTNLILYVSWGCCFPKNDQNISVRKSRFSLSLYLTQFHFLLSDSRRFVL